MKRSGRKDWACFVEHENSKSVGKGPYIIYASEILCIMCDSCRGILQVKCSFCYMLTGLEKSEDNLILVLHVFYHQHVSGLCSQCKVAL